MESIEQYWKKLKRRFHDLDRTKKAGTIYYGIALVIFLVFSYASLSAISTTNEILSSYKVPAGFISLNLDIEQQDYLYFYVSYEIPNRGGFTLSDVRISLSLGINYVNKSNFENFSRIIFFKTVKLGNCPSFSVLRGIINGSANDFNIDLIISINEEIDTYENSFYFLNYTFNAEYFFNLISIQTSRNNINLNCPLCG
jgi:hypothetical protein